MKLNVEKQFISKGLFSIPDIAIAYCLKQMYHVTGATLLPPVKKIRVLPKNFQKVFDTLQIIYILYLLHFYHFNKTFTNTRYCDKKV